MQYLELDNEDKEIIKEAEDLMITKYCENIDKVTVNDLLYIIGDLIFYIKYEKEQREKEEEKYEEMDYE